MDQREASRRCCKLWKLVLALLNWFVTLGGISQRPSRLWKDTSCMGRPERLNVFLGYLKTPAIEERLDVYLGHGKTLAIEERLHVHLGYGKTLALRERLNVLLGYGKTIVVR